MKYMRKDISITLIILAIIIIISIITILVFNLNNKNKISMVNNEINVTTNNVENIINEVVTKVSAANEIKISPNAQITYFKLYKDCGHVVKTKEKVSENMVNLNKSEMENLYSDWQINKFTNNEIELYKEYEGNCNEHYLVKEENEFITIYNIENSGELSLKEQTEISTKYLSTSDVKELKDGVKLYGKENLNAYIENFE